MDEPDVADQAEVTQEHGADETVEITAGDQPVLLGGHIDLIRPVRWHCIAIILVRQPNFRTLPTFEINSSSEQQAFQH
jgi:hypothetical protein